MIGPHRKWNRARWWVQGTKLGPYDRSMASMYACRGPPIWPAADVYMYYACWKYLCESIAFLVAQSLFKNEHGHIPGLRSHISDPQARLVDPKPRLGDRKPRLGLGGPKPWRGVPKPGFGAPEDPKPIGMVSPSLGLGS